MPNLRIMEIDVDRLAWDHELFTHAPEIDDGYLTVPDRPGWGSEPAKKRSRPSAKGSRWLAELWAQKPVSRRRALGYSGIIERPCTFCCSEATRREALQTAR